MWACKEWRNKAFEQWIDTVLLVCSTIAGDNISWIGFKKFPLWVLQWIELFGWSLEVLKNGNQWEIGGSRRKDRKNDYFNGNLKLIMSKGITQYNCYQPRMLLCG